MGLLTSFKDKLMNIFKKPEEPISEPMPEPQQNLPEDLERFRVQRFQEAPPETMYPKLETKPEPQKELSQDKLDIILQRLEIIDTRLKLIEERTKR